MSELIALYFMYNHFLFVEYLKSFKKKFLLFYFFVVIIILYDYFYEKHFELPLCMKCAIKHSQTLA